MSDPHIELMLDHDRLDFFPGETMAGHFRLAGVDPREIKAVELSILWSTEGKGEEDLAVHFFDRLEPSDGDVDLSQPCRFSTRLPFSPLSYEGLIVKICWCARVRVSPWRGKDLITEKSFQLGAIPPAQWTPP